MNIKKVLVDNFFCFGPEQILEFKEPVYQVIGERVGSENSSNGSGKSSLYYIIQEVMFGKNLKSTLKEYTGNIFTDPSSYSATVFLEHKGKNYEITLTRKKGKATLKFVEDGVDLSKHTVPDTYKLISSTLMDYDLFTMLTYLSPTVSTPNVLFLGTPKEKKDIFTKLFNLEDLVKLVDKATENVTKSRSTEKSLQDKLSGMKPVAVVSPGPEPNKNLIAELTASKEIKIATAGNLQQVINDAGYWNKIQTEKTTLEQWIAVNQFHSDIDPVAMSDKKDKLGQAERTLHVLKQKQKELSNAKTVCPMCGQKIQNSDHIAEELVTVGARVESGTAIIKQLQQEFDELDSKARNNLTYTSKQTRLNQLIEQVASANMSSKSVDMVQTELNKVNKEIKELDQQLIQLRRELDDWYKAEARYQHALELAAQYEIDKKQIEQDIIDTQETRIPDEVIMQNLGYSGFITAKIKNMAENLTSIINEYLAILSDGSLCIRFIPTDKLLFTLLKDGKELPINNLSAGQLTMLQLSSILALRDLVSANKGITIDLLVLDELFGTLDEIRRGILIDIMRQISIKGGQHILSISHLYNDSALPTITVRQENGVSRIIQ